MKKILVPTILSALIVACVTSKTTNNPSQADVDRVKTEFPNYNLAQLQEGQTLYTAKCASCHALKSPSSETAPEWKLIVPRMVGKANKKTENIDANQQDLILKYLITISISSK